MAKVREEMVEFSGEPGDAQREQGFPESEDDFSNWMKTYLEDDGRIIHREQQVRNDELTVSSTLDSETNSSSVSAMKDATSSNDLFKSKVSSTQDANLGKDALTQFVCIDKSTAHRLDNYGLLGRQLENKINPELVYMNTSTPLFSTIYGLKSSSISDSLLKILENYFVNCPPAIRSHSSSVDPEDFLSCLSILSGSDFHDKGAPQSLSFWNEFIEKLRSNRNSPRLQMLYFTDRNQSIEQNDFLEDASRFSKRRAWIRWDSISCEDIRQLLEASRNEIPFDSEVIRSVLSTKQSSQSLRSFENAINSSLPAEMQKDFKELFVFLKSVVSDSESFPPLFTMTPPEGELVLVDFRNLDRYPKYQVDFLSRIVLKSFRKRIGRKVLVLNNLERFYNDNKNSSVMEFLEETVPSLDHLNLNLIVSTNDAQRIPKEILALSSLSLIHRFHSKELFQHLSKIIPLKDTAFQEIFNLSHDEALLFSTKWSSAFYRESSSYGLGVFKIALRDGSL